MPANEQYDIGSMGNLIKKNGLEKKLNIDMKVVEELDNDDLILGDIDSETMSIKKEHFIMYYTMKNLINEILMKVDNAMANPIMLQSLERLFKTASDLLNSINNINKVERMALIVNNNKNDTKVDSISEDQIIREMRAKQLMEADKTLEILNSDSSN